MKAAGIDLGRWTGPVMVVDIPDHRKTGSYGSYQDARTYRENETQLIQEGNFMEAVEYGIADLRRVAEEAGNPLKYEQAITEMLSYIETIDPKRYTP
jgi:hypothetical protein